MSDIANICEKIDQLYQTWLQNYSTDNRLEDEVIYHYTSASGLQGILENRELWASNLAHVNDARELKIGISIFQEVARNLRREYKTENWDQILNNLGTKEPKTGVSNEDLLTIFQKENVRESLMTDLLAKKIKEKVKEEISSKLVSIKILEELLRRLQVKNTSNQYGCCFTEEGDQLSQWRAYGSYSVGFNAQQLLNELELNVQSCQIIYSTEEQQKLVTGLIKSFLTDMITPLKDDLKNTEDLEIDEVAVKIINLLEELIDQLIVSFKDKGFSEEKERRIYLYTENQDIIDIRERNGFFIPFIKLKMKNNRHLPIQEIYVSPTADFERASQGLQFLLAKTGYHHVNVRASSIPYRL